jgi:hypothetical protein
VPTQQIALYEAELEISPGPDFASIDAVQQWVDQLREEWWWEKWVSQVLGIDVYLALPCESNQGWFSDIRSSGVMIFETPTPSLQLAVHELAHVLAEARRYSQSHDPWYARILTELVYLLRGANVYLELTAAFARHDVDYDAGGLA